MMKCRLMMALALAAGGNSGVAAQTEGPDFYGKLHIAYVGADEGGDNLTGLESFASRVGVKGSQALDGGLQVIYQVEYEVPADGDGDLSPRDIFLGFAGSYGQLQLGRMSTPLRTSQGKFDLFNDQTGDLRVYTPNENRVDDIVMYTSPSAAGFNLQLAHIASEDNAVDNGVSAALLFEQGAFYAALSYDRNVDAPETEAVRATFVYQRDAWHLGILAEQHSFAEGEEEDAVVGSIGYELDDHWRLKAQYGISDITREGLDALSLGVDYQWDKNLRLFAFYTERNSDALWDGDGPDGEPVLFEEGLDDRYLALGAEFRFGG